MPDHLGHVARLTPSQLAGIARAEKRIASRPRYATIVCYGPRFLIAPADLWDPRIHGQDYTTREEATAAAEAEGYVVWNGAAILNCGGARRKLVPAFGSVE